MARKKQTIPMLRVETRVKGETFDWLESRAIELYDGNRHLCNRLVIEAGIKALKDELANVKARETEAFRAGLNYPTNEKPPHVKKQMTDSHDS